MQGIRQRNVAPGSSLGEVFLQTYLHPTAANDYGEVFVFPRASRIQITELGISCGVLTGTSMAAEIAYLAAGLVGTEALIQDAITGGYATLYTHVGGAYELTAAGFATERADHGQPYLAQLLNKSTDGQGSNAFDSETNLHFRLGINVTAITVSTNTYAFCRAKIWYPEDE